MKPNLLKKRVMGAHPWDWLCLLESESRPARPLRHSGKMISGVATARCNVNKYVVSARWEREQRRRQRATATYDNGAITVADLLIFARLP